jgi:Carboxypeptidase regulatory-like domain
MNRTRYFTQTLTFFMLLALSLATAMAQTGTSAIRGQVLDSQSLAIPSARVTITDESSKLIRTQTAGESGEFAFVGLPPAAYRLDCEAPGFRKLTIERVTAAVDSTADVPLHLEVGEVTQTVTVSSGQVRVWS